MHNLLKRFRRDDSGSILLLTGLSFLFLVGIGGAGYDLGHQQLVRQKIQQASDAGALAGATLPGGSSDDARRSTALAFFNLNYPPEYLGIPRPTGRATVTATTVHVEANTQVDTSFVGNFGVEHLTSRGASTVGISTTANKIDMVLVMDNSFSMGAEDVGSANSLPSDLSQAQLLNICRDYFGQPAVRAFYRGQYGGSGDFRPFCRVPYVSKAGDYDLNDGQRPPHPVVIDLAIDNGATRMNALRYSGDQLASDLLNPNRDDHRIATVTWSGLVMSSQDFTGDYATVRIQLMRMFGAPNTDSTSGLGRAEQLAAGFRNNTVHVVVLLTDGRNEPDDQAPAINAASVAACTRLKSRPDTLIYTIAFGQEILSTSGPKASLFAAARQYLSDCASGEHGSSKPNQNQFYFTAPDAEALDNAFDSIVTSARKVQIIQ